MAELGKVGSQPQEQAGISRHRRTQSVFCKCLKAAKERRRSPCGGRLARATTGIYFMLGVYESSVFIGTCIGFSGAIKPARICA